MNEESFRTAEKRMDGADRHYLHNDDELMRRWLWARSNNKAKRGGQLLWSVVMEDFCVGSTSAVQICKRHGFDPDVMVRRG